MKFFGRSRAILTNKLCTDKKCPKCGLKGNVELTVYSTHYHILGIPLFQAGKSFDFHCHYCNWIEGEEEKLEDDFYREYKHVFKRQRAPLWQYSGLIVVITSGAYLLYFTLNKPDKTGYYAVYPEQGDVYLLKALDGKTIDLLEISKVNRDSIYLKIKQTGLLNQQEAEKEISTQSKSYNQLGFSKLEVIENVENHIIIKIIRK